VASKKSTMSDKRPIKIPVLGLMGFVFLFMLLSLSTGSIERFSVSSLVEGFTVPLSTANQGLTWYLVMSAFGVLAGGYLADRTTKHGFIAAAAFALAATFVILISSVALPAMLLITAMAIVGFLTGIVAPSRDMLVRAASPKGAEGRTFGIVSTGFNIGGVVGPVFLGYLLDQHLAKEVMWAIVAFMLLTTIVVLLQEFRSKRQSAS
jgi:MFS family permease